MRREVKVEQAEGRDYGPFQINRIHHNLPSTYTKIGHWSQKENMKYYAFLKRFEGMFDERQMRREWKVFKAMAEFLKTRNASQCRSHHHKMQKDFSSIKQTLASLEGKMPGIDEKAQKYLQKLNKVSFLTISNNQYKATEIPVHTKQAVDFQIKQQAIENKKTSQSYDELENNLAQQQRSTSSFSERERDLAECHQCFVKWWSKLNYLMSFSDWNS